MSGSKTIQCKKCDKNIVLETGMAKGFCLHCGEPFEVKEDVISANDADKLYAGHEWRLLLDYVENEKNDPRLIAYKRISAFFVLVLNYERDVDALAKNSKSWNPISFFFTSKSSFAYDPVHNLFYDDLEHSISALDKLFQSPHMPADLKADASRLIVAELLQPKGEEASATYWSFVACQQHAAPIIPYMSLDALLEAYNDYDYRNPKNQSLPNQLKVRDAFVEAIKMKGGNVPSHGQVRKAVKEQQKQAKQKGKDDSEKSS